MSPEKNMDTDTETDLETKAAFSPDRPMTHGEFMSAFDEFKASNEERLAQVERRGAVDPLTEDKQARIDAALQRRLDRQQEQIDELMLKQVRPAFASAPAAVRSFAAREHKAAFEAYVRRGDSAALRQLEVKALSAGSGPDGGYLVPPEVETEIGARLAAISPIRSIASVRTVSANVYKKPFMTSGPAVGWVGETDARPQTGSPVLDELNFPVMELYAMPAATATLLEDAAVNIDQWIASEVELAFAAQEGAAFVAGDGVARPKGFLSYPTVANASWQWSKIGYIATGVAGNWPASNPSDVLVDLIYSLKAGYRQNGVFVMNRKTQSAIRKFKDTTGQLSVAAAGVLGGRATLLELPGRRVGGHAGHRRRRATPSPSAISPAAISWSTAPASACCAIPTAPSPTCCSTPPSAWAAACRTSTRSSC